MGRKRGIWWWCGGVDCERRVLRGWTGGRGKLMQGHGFSLASLGPTECPQISTPGARISDPAQRVPGSASTAWRLGCGVAGHSGTPQNLRTDLNVDRNTVCRPEGSTRLRRMRADPGQLTWYSGSVKTAPSCGLGDAAMLESPRGSARDAILGPMWP